MSTLTAYNNNIKLYRVQHRVLYADGITILYKYRYPAECIGIYYFGTTVPGVIERDVPIRIWNIINRRTVTTGNTCGTSAKILLRFIIYLSTAGPHAVRIHT